MKYHTLQYVNIVFRRTYYDTCTLPCVFSVRPETIVFGRTYVLVAFISLFFHRVISELRRPIVAKFCMILGPAFNFIIPVQNFEEASPKKF